MTYEPTEAQGEITESTAPTLVVLGGAGTGKTITAAAAAAAHIQRADAERDHQRQAMRVASPGAEDLPPRARVLFLSFSRTAVAQVIDRAGPVVGPLLDRIDVATFHGFAYRILTDFGPRYGYPPPLRIQSEAETRVPGAPAGMRYQDLVPAAMKVLSVPTVSDYYARRYSLVISDEFQDTGDDEWAFLQAIAPDARRVLLADINQCIYGELKGIDPGARIAEALALPGAVRLELPPASHRDPSGVLPAAALEALERRFDGPAIAVAVASDRLRAVRSSEEDAYGTVIDIVRSERIGRNSIGIFTHTNTATAALSDALTAASLPHEQVGFSEAYGEALNAQLALVNFALTGASPRRALAVYVASNYRRNAPLAGQIIERSNPAFERALAAVLEDLQGACQTELDGRRLAGIIAMAYSRVGTHRGQRTWREAARRTRTALLSMADGSRLEDVAAALEQARLAALVGDSAGRRHPIQVMNLHQTKGREADATIVLIQPDEFHGREEEPFPTLSRLLYVVLTRARHRAHIVVPGDVHRLWEPLVRACTPGP